MIGMFGKHTKRYHGDIDNITTKRVGTINARSASNRGTRNQNSTDFASKVWVTPVATAMGENIKFYATSFIWFYADITSFTIVLLLFPLVISRFIFTNYYY